MRVKKSFCLGFIFIFTGFNVVLFLFNATTVSASNKREVNLQVSHPFFARKIQKQIVSSVFRDSSDLLWVGTQEGLFRFDGYHLTQYFPGGEDDHYIQSSDIRGITEDRSGRIIVATFGGGLLVSNQERNRFSSAKSDQSHDLSTLTSIYSLKDGSLWITTKESLISLDHNFSVRAVLRSDVELEPIGDVTGIVLLEDGAYYVGGKRGIGHFSIDGSGNPTALQIVYPKGISAITDADEKALLAAKLDGSILRIDPGSGVVQFSNPELSENTNSVSKLLWFEGRVWAGTSTGLKIYNSDLTDVVELNSSNSDLSNGYITDLDRSGRQVWLGTYQGISVVSQSNIALYTRKNSGIHDDVHAIGEDAKGNLWIGTYDGLYVKRNGQSTHERWGSDQGSGLFDERIMTIAASDQEIWLGFREGGIQVLRSQSAHSYSSLSEMTSGFAVTKILHASSGATWIATYNQGLHHFDGVDLVHHTSIPEKSVTVVFEKSDGKILVVSERRLYQFRPETNSFSEISLEFEGLSHSPRILSLGESATAEILVGTKDHGLFSSSTEGQGSNTLVLRKLGSPKRYRNLTIYSIHSDESGHIWVSTQEGIQVFDYTNSPVVTLRARDGLQANDFNFGASLKGSDGSLYFGGVLGYNRINPAELSINSRLPILRLLRISTPNQSLDTLTNNEIESFVTTFEDYLVTFTFSVMDFLSTEAHQYRYKLEGFDPDWIENGNRNTATYTNLPAGDYVFRVIGANSAGIWNEDGVRLAVKVLPPPWQTWWAYCFYAIGLIGLFWIGKKFYDTYAVKEQAVKMAEDMIATAHRVEDELQYQQEFQDEMVQEIYRHNLDTLELLKQSAMSGPEIEGEHVSGQSTRLQRQVDILSLLEANYFYQPEGLLANLNQFTEALISRLLPEASVPVESITTVNKVPHTLIPAHVASPIALVLSELLENALLHAFNADSPANYIEIELANTDIDGAGAGYRLTVSDTGCGLPPGVSPASATTPGLALIRGLAAHTRGSFTLSSDEGCVATFSLPLDQETPR